MTDTHAFNDARRLCAHLRCRRYCISVAAMWVVVFHPQRQQFEKIIVESSKETVDALVERQQKHVKLGIEGHRQAMRQKQEAENLLQSLRSPRLPQAVARTAEPVQAPAALTVGADGIAAVGTVVESTASSTDVVGTTVMFIGRFCGADAKELRAAARRKGMVIRTNTFRVDHAVVGTVSIKSTRLELALASGARRLSADEQLANYPETLVCDGTAGTNRHRKKLVHVVATNGNLKPAHICSAVVDGETKRSILFVYDALAFIMKNAGLATCLRRTRVLMSDFALGCVRAHRGIAVQQAFGGSERVVVVSFFRIFFKFSARIVVPSP